MLSENIESVIYVVHKRLTLCMGNRTNGEITSSREEKRREEDKRRE
tara:strand:+ start:399 stop:536 length:138 start_codon:yes stop_codon:yes gene_type:complete